ncbi:hypothetical protein E2C01_051400 [Portunus trituberculatus]|uniref:Uncharacterized protein n=1 Tax=Portunus trituberculatus TaxID=210409 RepID=A0A5B7GBH7_PORTR|nr:hypothetical protein [Portunus trituberculatus]
MSRVPYPTYLRSRQEYEPKTTAAGHRGRGDHDTACTPAATSPRQAIQSENSTLTLAQPSCVLLHWESREGDV